MRKIATCCYCGTRAALVLRGDSRHELSCAACGAPLHEMKAMPCDAQERGKAQATGRAFSSLATPPPSPSRPAAPTPPPPPPPPPRSWHLRSLAQATRRPPPRLRRLLLLRLRRRLRLRLRSVRSGSRPNGRCACGLQGWGRVGDAALGFRLKREARAGLLAPAPPCPAGGGTRAAPSPAASRGRR